MPRSGRLTMSSRTTTTPTGDPKQPDCLPFREMVPLPQSLFSTEFLGTPVPTHAPSRAAKPANPKLSVPGVTFGAPGDGEPFLARC